MNIAIEYMLRNQRIAELLRFPCSLFLEKRRKKKENKLVVVLTSLKDDMISVKQYSICKTDKSILPPTKENIIHSSEIFSHPDVIVPKMHLLEFKEVPYITPEKHMSDMPHSAIQEKAYKNTLERFFNPIKMQQMRENWLWETFEKIYVQDTVRSQYNVTAKRNPIHQREYVAHYDKVCWEIWEHWKKTMLDFDGPATELVFAKAYKSKFATLKIGEEKPSTNHHSGMGQLGHANLDLVHLDGQAAPGQDFLNELANLV